jgi:hypothetical protein
MLNSWRLPRPQYSNIIFLLPIEKGYGDETSYSTYANFDFFSTHSGQRYGCRE